MLSREEYVEQAYLFKALDQRMSESDPIQRVMAEIKEEILVTTKLPMAIDFLLAEMNHNGTMTGAMQRLRHYFSDFQAFVIEEAEQHTGRFDLLTAFRILHHESKLRADGVASTTMFLYQFETICRNRLPYYEGLQAMSRDPVYDQRWQNWLSKAQRQIESVGLADLIYVHSEYYAIQQRRKFGEVNELENSVLFGEREGKIALANRKKQLTSLFSALQRQLDYPAAPRRKTVDEKATLLPKLIKQMERMELRIKLVEEEQRTGGIDLTQFMGPNK